MRQHRYGNVDPREGAIVGALSALGVLGGAALANVLPQRALKLSFATLTLLVAAHWTLEHRRGASARVGLRLRHDRSRRLLGNRNPRRLLGSGW